jgi:hypothetical protein
MLYYLVLYVCTFVFQSISLSRYVGVFFLLVFPDALGDGTVKKTDLIVIRCYFIFF